jgi:hypothetical protein
LNAAPWGLGGYLAGGYLTDMTMFWCPSTGGQMASPTSVRYESGGQALYNKGRHPNHFDYTVRSYLRNVRLLGGTDGKALTHGDYSSFPNVLFYDDRGVALACDYAYRPLPDQQNRTYGGDVPGYRGHPVYGYKPTLYSHTNEVPFKNQRRVGSRALVIDAFSNFMTGSGNPTTMTTYGENPGYGYWAHRVGYNILAGDGHASWMGDPQERHIYWHKSGWTTPGGLNTLGSEASAGGWTALTGGRVGAGAWAWHQFDTYLGVDADQ